MLCTKVLLLQSKLIWFIIASLKCTTDGQMLPSFHSFHCSTSCKFLRSNLSCPSRSATATSCNFRAPVLWAHHFCKFYVIFSFFRLEELNVFDVEFLHGCSNPTIILIHQDLNGRHIKVINWYNKHSCYSILFKKKLILLSFNFRLTK